MFDKKKSKNQYFLKVLIFLVSYDHEVILYILL